MPPESDGDIRTIGCSLDKFIFNTEHSNKIKKAVLSTHSTDIDTKGHVGKGIIYLNDPVISTTFM